MPSADIHRALIYAELALGLLTVFALLVVRAPYGRHARAGWGPSLPARVAWLLMELPALAGFVGLYALGQHALEPAPLVLLGLWVFHYGQRALVYPLRMPATSREMPAVVAAMGASFNVLNALVNAPQVSQHGAYPASWLQAPALWIGAALFFAGWILNVRADQVLLRLKAKGGGYAVPSGALHDLVASPNYLGELVEWTGWAIATWSLAGASFALYTAANLVPRALDNLRWYRDRFPEYPRERRAIIPFVL